MPTYDYRCDACGHEFELFQSMSAPVKRKCPACGKIRLQRLIGTGAGVIFKGSGFYETDYRSESYKKAAETESKPADDGAKTESKSDSSTGETKSTDEKKTNTKTATEKKGTTAGSNGSHSSSSKKTKKKDS